jgi:hypothetical protein
MDHQVISSDTSMPRLIALLGGDAQFRACLESTMKYLLGKHNLHDWGFRLDKARSRAGVCNYRLRQICLSRYFVTSKYVNYESFYNIILHEIAHALTPGHGHNKVWQAVARGIGCDGNTFCQPFCSHKYTGVCKCSEKIHYRHQLRSKCSVRCKFCKNNIEFVKTAS